MLPWIKSVSRNNNPKSTALRPRRRRRPSFVPRLESLEDRINCSLGTGSMSDITHPVMAFGQGGPSADDPPPVPSATQIGLSPSQLRHAYGFDDIAFAGGFTGQGAGQAIAVVVMYHHPNIEADLKAFNRQCGLPDCFFYQFNVDNTPTAPPTPYALGWGSEARMDIQWAHAMAPLATIVLVEASDLYEGVDYARNLEGVSVISMSWGSTEIEDESDKDSYFKTPAGHTGITFVAASGDQHGHRPGDYPAFSPNVLAVGGTAFAPNLSSNGNYTGEIAWDRGGGDISKYEGQPGFQKGIVSQSATRRTIPDVSLDAGSGVAVFDSYDFGAATPWVSMGGTSLSTPCMAGLIACANEGRIAQGMNTLKDQEAMVDLYKIYSISKQNGLGSFGYHDVTTGDNHFHSAGQGFDLATGLGTPKAAVIASALARSAPEAKLVSPGLLGVNTTTPTFQWEPVAGAVGYRLRVLGTSGNTVIDQQVAGTAYVPGPGILSRGTNYKWQVQSFSILGQKDVPASTFSFFTITSAIPTPLTPFLDQAVTSTRPTFTWSVIGGATSYTVSVVDAQTHTTVASASSLTGTSWTPPVSLTNGRGYQWQVQAYTSDNGSIVANAPSSPLYFFVNVTGALTLLSPAAGSTISSNSPRLQWTPVPGVVTFQLRIFDTTTGAPVMNVPIAKAFFDVPVPLASGHKYQWTVATVDGSPDMTASAQFTVSVSGATGTLAAPTLIGPSGLVTTETPTFSWSAVPGAAGYSLFVFYADSLATSWISPVRVTGTSYSAASAPAGFTNGYAFIWWVTAYDNAGNVSARSQALDYGAAIPLQFTKTVSPIGPTGQIGTLNPTFQWSLVTGAQGYYLYIVDETLHTPTFDNFVTGTSYTFGSQGGASLQNGHTYRWYLSAVTQRVGPASMLTFTTAAPGTPKATTSGGLQSTTTPTLEWSSSSGATGYFLSVVDQSSNTTVVDSVPLTGTSYRLSVPLSTTSTYVWQVSAYDDAGNSSPASDPVDFTVTATIDPPTLDTLVDPVTTTTPTLSWSQVTSAAGYNLYLIDTTTNTPILDGLSLATTSITVKPLIDGHGYEWWVVAYDEAGNTSSSSTPAVFSVEVPKSAAAVPVPEKTAIIVPRAPELRWKAAQGAVSYVVDVVDVSLGQFDFVVEPTEVSDTTFAISTTLIPGHIYVWHVKAVDSAGIASEWANPSQFTMGADLGLSTLDVEKLTLELGSTRTITFIARDANGNQETAGGLDVQFALGSGIGQGSFGPVTDNGDGTYTVSFTATAVGANTITVKIGGEAITSTPAELIVTPGPVSLSHSVLSIASPSIAVTGATTVTFTARDASENREITGGLPVTFSLVTAAGITGSFGNVVDHGDGTYTATFTADTTCGSGTIIAQVNGQPVSSTAIITVTPGPASLAKSAITLSSAGIAAGRSITVTFIARDAFNNQETSGGLNVVFELGSATPGGVFGQVMDHGDGSYTATFTASSGLGTNAITASIGGQAVTSTAPSLTFGLLPVVTSTKQVTFSVGAASAFSLRATGSPAPALEVGGHLPNGVSFDASTGTLRGTPGAGTAGVYQLTISASNLVGKSETQNFTLTVHQGKLAPAINSLNHAEFTVGMPGSFTLTGTGSPAPSFSKTGGALPAGLTLKNGIISGNPSAGTGGVYRFSIVASNGVSPNFTQNFVLTISEAPAFTSLSSMIVTAGHAVTPLRLTARGFPAPVFGAVGDLPAGMKLANGYLIGTPAAGLSGTYTITLTASNGVGSLATQTFTLAVRHAPIITSANNATFVVWAAGTPFNVTATGFPAPVFSKNTGTLPAGLTFKNGVISGAPSAGTGGIYRFSIVASNGVAPNPTQNFVLTVNERPTFTSPSSMIVTAGQSVTPLKLSARGFPAPVFGAIGDLPAGMRVVNGYLTGTPATELSGVYTITLTASNGVGSPVTQTFTFAVRHAPVITSANDVSFLEGEVATPFDVKASGFPGPTFSASGVLPGGMNFAGGKISGTPAAGTVGKYQLIITASNGLAPSAVQTLTLTVGQTPTITSASTVTFGAGVEATPFKVTATGLPSPVITELGTLPDGVVFENGFLKGTPAADSAGDYPITFTASNGFGIDAVQNFMLKIIGPPVFTSPSSYTFVVNEFSSFTPMATGSPAPTISVSGILPPGVQFVNGSLVGVPFFGTQGYYFLTLTATNSFGAQTIQYFTLTVFPGFIFFQAAPHSTISARNAPNPESSGIFDQWHEAGYSMELLALALSKDKDE